MQVLAFQTPQILSSTTYKNARPLSGSITTLPFSPLVPRKITRSSPSSCNGVTSSFTVQCREAQKDAAGSRLIRSHALNVGAGSGSYDESEGNDSQSSLAKQHTETSSNIEKSPDRIPYLFPIAVVLCSCTLAFLLILFKKGPTSILPALAKSGFTAAFSLIFVSEIGDKTFFIAALLAMQYDKLLVLLGSVGALALMTVLSVVIGRIFHSVPAQFQTTLPIGEYAAVTLLVFFGLKAIKDAWDLPSAEAKTGELSNQESDEFTEAEELVKEKASKRLSNPLEVIWKSFSLVFFAEWGDRSMLATIALGAAQSPWGVASGAIVGHLIATSLAILGGALLAKYISEKLVGYVGGVLFIVFGIATFFGAF
ncbi:protein PAM71-homolog, chloroplastic isoform X1 [Salvia hispanica]|uniref:protein PAM71-homolog, chloroplastic isoform X1 n=1 Tax=Salvia hispanica TaxID=49212 RepID=UPI00200996C2|nr:protein PAM71-homolog, chloroplastic isoform X1 [Salvia hispanica]